LMSPETPAEQQLPEPQPVGVAVGTVLADGPPHRSQRAELPHWAPALGSGCEARIREGMHHTGLR
jgi:hypothetical protein